MSKLNYLLVSVMMLLPGCALWPQPQPVSASCPPVPDLPVVVVEYATPPMNLIEESGSALLDFERELRELLQSAKPE